MVRAVAATAAQGGTDRIQGIIIAIGPNGPPVATHRNRCAARKSPSRPQGIARLN